MTAFDLIKPLNSKILSAVLTGAIAALLWVFFTNEAFFEWAFDRHQNILSWWARPLLLIPFCLAAWYRSLNGVLLSVLALLTSMFWFDVPAVPSANVVAFLEVERAILSKGWSVQNIAGALGIMIYFALLTRALWKRSLRLGLAVIALGAAIKVVWSYANSAQEGHTVAIVAGVSFVILLVAFWGFARSKGS